MLESVETKIVQCARYTKQNPVRVTIVLISSIAVLCMAGYQAACRFNVLPIIERTVMQVLKYVKNNAVDVALVAIAGSALLCYAGYQAACKYNIVPRVTDFIKRVVAKVSNVEFFDTENANRFAMFYVDWCPHCKRAMPMFEELTKEMGGTDINGKRIVFEKVNCEEQEEVANQFGVQAYPTFFLVKKGENVEYTHALSKEGVSSFLQKHCN